MLTLFETTPTELWIALGRRFFGTKPSLEETVDLKLGDRRFVCFTPELWITNWPLEWTGNDLAKIVGYSPRGSKMNTLRETYVNEDAFKKLKRAIKEKQHNKFMAVGMNFNMKASGKGGCLSSFHVLRNHKMWWIVIHGKIAEIPRKFVADMRLTANLIRELELSKGEIMVKYMFSSIYYSIVGLRAYIPVLGKENMDFHSLPISDFRNYQVGIQEAIGKFRWKLAKEYGKKIIEKGLEDKFDMTRGELI